jgi:hypothetical protein
MVKYSMRNCQMVSIFNTWMSIHAFNLAEADTKYSAVFR